MEMGFAEVWDRVTEKIWTSTIDEGDEDSSDASDDD